MDKWYNKFAFHVYHLTNVFRVVEKVIWNGVTTIFRRYSSGFPGVGRNPTPLCPRKMATTRRGDSGKTCTPAEAGPISILCFRYRGWGRPPVRRLRSGSTPRGLHPSTLRGRWFNIVSDIDKWPSQWRTQDFIIGGINLTKF